MGDSSTTGSADCTILTRSLVIAGLIKSGKTSLAKALSYRSGVPRASFGDEVRRRAAIAGLDCTDRRVLQDLGERLVNDDPSGFAQAVIDSAAPRRSRGQPVILDGIRHIHILQILCVLLSDTGVTLVYVDTPPDVRKEWAGAHAISTQALALADSHRSEAQSDALRSAADVVVRVDGAIEPVIDKLLARLSAV